MMKPRDKLSIESLERIAIVICGGSIEYTTGGNEYFTAPYRTMHDISLLMKHVGLTVNSTLSRYKAIIATLVDNNSHATMTKLIAEAVKPIKFITSGSDLDATVEYLNTVLSFDGLQVKLKNNIAKLIPVSPSYIETDELIDIRGTGGDYVEFLRYYDEKIDTRLQNSDYDGAITVAKTKIERQLDFIHETIAGTFDNKADFNQKYKAVTKLINLDVSSGADRPLKKILSGLFSVIDGMAQLRNEVADSHPAQYRAEERHAILAVNASRTISAFLHDVCENQMHDGYPLITWAKLDEMIDVHIDFAAQRKLDEARGK